MRLWFQSRNYLEIFVKTEVKMMSFTGNFGETSSQEKSVSLLLT